MIALFEKCSSTSEEKKAPVKPLILNASLERIFQIVLKDANENERYGIKSKHEFFEIYYWRRYMALPCNASPFQRSLH